MINIELPHCIYQNRFYEFHPHRVSNTLRVALAILGAAALSVATEWPYAIEVSTEVGQLFLVVGAIAILAAVLFQFVKPYTLQLKNKEDFEDLEIKKVEKFEIIGRENFKKIEDQLKEAKKMWWFSYCGSDLEDEDIEKLEATLMKLPKLKEIYINRYRMVVKDGELVVQSKVGSN